MHVSACRRDRSIPFSPLSRVAANLLITAFVLAWWPAPGWAQDYSVPIRWCVIANDTNDNGEFDAGEEGAPAFTDPGDVGETATDLVLWRRHERPSEAAYIPQAGVTLRSALWNIAEDETLNFPIIPDQDTSDPDHEVGDILDHRIDATEWNLTYNACVDAWSDDHGVEDIGIVAVNARRIVDEDGNSAFFAWAFSPSARRTYLEDNAWSFCGSTSATSSVCDPVDKTFGHEVGHVFGLSHTCDNSNIMRSGRRDTNGDDSLDNFLLSSSIDEVTGAGDDGSECTDDDTTAEVDQIATSAAAAQTIPGCKIVGTNDDCSTQSDVATDALHDVEPPYLDLTRLRLSEHQESDTSEIAHELFGPFVLDAFDAFTELEYFAAIDLDGDETTGGDPTVLGFPVAFSGAEIVTRVRVQLVVVGVAPPVAAASFGPPVLPLSGDPTVWRFEGGAFAEVEDPSIQAHVEAVVSTGDGPGGIEEFHSSDWVVIEMSNDVRGPKSLPLRIQAATRGDAAPPVVDSLPVPKTGDGPELKLRFPTFPLCSVAPDPVAAGGFATVDSSGLLPGAAVHVVFGDEEVAAGVTDAAGDSSVLFPVPVDATPGAHLVTVGVEGTGLTADCIVRTEPPEPVTYQYAAKLICGTQKKPRVMRLAKGFYATTVNIHNPGPGPVTFRKKLALTEPPGHQKPGEVLPIAVDRLGPDEALAVDCDDIARRVFGGQLPAPFIEGFVVIESPSSLDATAVYSTAALDRKGHVGAHSSIHVEPVRERVVRRAGDPERLPDLVVRDIRMESLQVSCPGGGGTCVTTVDVVIENQGAGDAGAFVARTVLDPAQSVVVDRPFGTGLASGVAQSYTAVTPPGGNCFDPNCRVCVTVDADGEVPESDETNNQLCEERLG